MLGYELRASAAPRLRPANHCAIDSVQKARSRADGLARADLRDANCSPPPGGGRRLLHPFRAQIQNAIFNISCALIFGSQPAKDASDVKELRAFAAGGCGPPTSCEVDSTHKANPPPGGGCGLLRFLPEPHSKLLLGPRPAERSQIRQRTAGLRCREAAARSAFARPICVT